MKFPVGNIADNFFDVKFEPVQQENYGNAPVYKFFEVEYIVVTCFIGNNFPQNNHQNEK